MEASKYLEKFEANFKEFGERVTLKPGTVIIEIPPTEERKTTSGIIVGSGSNQVNSVDNQAMVKAVVVAYEPEDEVPTLRVGNVVMTTKESIKRQAALGEMLALDDGYELALMTENSAIMRFDDVSTYNSFFEGM
jgi:exosome complex RNA-binding protein Csl4